MVAEHDRKRLISVVWFGFHERVVRTRLDEPRWWRFGDGRDECVEAVLHRAEPHAQQALRSADRGSAGFHDAAHCREHA